MCGRFGLISSLEELEDYFALIESLPAEPEMPARYNIAPTRLGTPKKLFREYFKRMGPGGHRYNKQTENNSLIRNTPVTTGAGSGTPR